MIEVIWTYRVRKESLADFEHYYRADGVWAELFRKAPEYRGTTLLRDRDDPLRFATVDRWESWEAYERFLREHRNSYEMIDGLCADFTTEETKVGAFDSVDAMSGSTADRK
jgi:heme-degrading monooxygenase HmoA